MGGLTVKEEESIGVLIRQMIQKNEHMMTKDAFYIIEQIIAVNESIIGKKVLDIGCGDGWMTAILQKYANSITGVDPSISAVEMARKTVSHADIFVQSGENLSFSDNTFDTVLFAQSLHHHDDPDAALKEARRVVCLGGMIIVIEPVNNSELMQVCAPFDIGERERLEQVKAVLSEYKYQKHQAIYPVWGFSDISQLHAWLAEYYKETANSRNHALAESVIAPKRDEVPLYVQYELLMVEIMCP